MNQIAKRAGSAIIWKAVQLIASKLIYLVRTIVLAAILFPTDFGLLSISLVAMDFLMSITNLGLSQALIQKEVKNENIFDTIWTIGFLRGLLLTITLYFSSDFIAVLFDEPRVAGILQVLAFKPLIDELSSIKVAQLMKELNFKSFASIKIAESLISTLIAIVFAPSLGIWALIYGILAGSITYFIFSYIFAPYKPKFNLAITTIRSFISFGVWIFLISFIAVTANIVFQIIITRNLGASALGLYYLAYKIAFLAVEVSSEVIGSVAFSVYSIVQTNFEKISMAWDIIIRGITIIYFPIVCFLIGLSPYLIEYLPGSKWEGTEKLIQLLAVAGIFGTFGEAVVPVLKGLGKPQKVMLIELVQHGLLITTVYFFCKYFGIAGAAVAWILAGIGSFVSCLIFLKQIQIKPFAGNMIFFSVILASSFLGTIISKIILSFWANSIGFICAVILGVGTTVALIWLSNAKFNLGIAELIDKVFPKLKFSFSTKSN